MNLMNTQTLGNTGIQCVQKLRQYRNKRGQKPDLDNEQNKNAKLIQGKWTTYNEFNEYTNIREYKNSMKTETRTVQNQQGTGSGLRQ